MPCDTAALTELGLRGGLDKNDLLKQVGRACRESFNLSLIRKRQFLIGGKRTKKRQLPFENCRFLLALTVDFNTTGKAVRLRLTFLII